MGTTYADITLTNFGDLEIAARKLMSEDEVRSMSVRVLVDTGAYMLCINEEICAQLGLRKLSEETCEFGDGSVRTLDVVGPVDLRFANRQCSCNAIVLPANVEPLLGVIPMEDLDVVVDPRSQELKVNPKHPNYAGKYCRSPLKRTHVE
ncbi:MAG: clan AA aspartic protease [Thermoguttaceae bacterium]